MPNILISNVCNRSCPYCFAMSAMPDSTTSGERFMSDEDIANVIKFLKKSGTGTLSLIGGEPTLHPKFRDIVSSALDEGLKVFVFSNGIMSHETASHLANLPDDKIGLLINVNHPSTYAGGQFDRLETTLSLFGVKASLGYNIHSLDFDFTFIGEIALRHGTKKNIRLGLAQPIIGGKNQYIKTSDYPLIAGRLVEQAEFLDSSDISVGFDCGFVLCMFTREQMGRLAFCRTQLDFYCGPVVDIGTNLDVWACFPLTEWKKVRMEDFENASGLVSHFEKEELLYHKSGIYANCLGCKYMERGQCAGGCISHVIAGFSQPKLKGAR